MSTKPFDQLTIAQAQEVVARFQFGEPQHYTYSFDGNDNLLCRQYVPATYSHLSAIAPLAEVSCQKGA